MPDLTQGACGHRCHPNPGGTRNGVSRLWPRNRGTHRTARPARVGHSGFGVGSCARAGRRLSRHLGWHSDPFRCADWCRDDHAVAASAFRSGRRDDSCRHRAAPSVCCCGHADHVRVGAFCPESLWMLPGLWQILFSLGIFASKTHLLISHHWQVGQRLSVVSTALLSYIAERRRK
jgi:hypothetical protein